MANTPDPKQADGTEVSADGAVELTETQLETAEGGLGLMPGTLAHEGIKLTTITQKLDIVSGKLSTSTFKIT